MAIRYASDKFIRAVSDNGRFGEGLRAVLRRGNMGFAIMRHDIRLGLIRATRAYVPATTPSSRTSFHPDPTGGRSLTSSVMPSLPLPPNMTSGTRRGPPRAFRVAAAPA